MKPKVLIAYAGHKEVNIELPILEAGGASVVAELAERLAAAAPGDLARVELGSYKGLVAPWNDWTHLRAAGRRHAAALAGLVLGGAR